MFTHATPFNPVDDNRTHPFHREHGSSFGGLEDVWFPSLLVLLAVSEKLTSGLSVGLMDYLLVWYLCLFCVYCSVIVLNIILLLLSNLSFA